MGWLALRIDADCARVFFMRKHAMKMFFLTCVLLLSAGTCLAGPLYRWVDSDGRVHYSDQPPPPSAKDVQ
jgi:hypothetical protein